MSIKLLLVVCLVAAIGLVIGDGIDEHVKQGYGIGGGGESGSSEGAEESGVGGTEVRVGVLCGKVYCKLNQQCCNPMCSICTSQGAFCDNSRTCK